MIDVMDSTYNGLDRWYSGRVRKNYSPEVEEIFKTRMVEGVNRNTLLYSQIDSEWTKENLVMSAGSYFSRGYRQLEDLVIEIGVDRVGSASGLIDFVEEVRKKSNEVAPGELEDGHIDECFRGVFAAPNEFAEAIYSAILTDRAEIEDEYSGDEHERNNLQRYISAMKNSLPYLMENIFGDLYSYE